MALYDIFMCPKNIDELIYCCCLCQSLFTLCLFFNYPPYEYRPMMGPQILSTYHLTINLLSSLTIYALDNGFRIFLPTRNLLICNEILYHDKVLIQIYMNQTFEQFLFAILRQLTFLIPNKFIHEPFCVEKALILNYCMQRYKKSNLLPLDLLL